MEAAASVYTAARVIRNRILFYQTEYGPQKESFSFCGRFICRAGEWLCNKESQRYLRFSSFSVNWRIS